MVAARTEAAVSGAVSPTAVDVPTPTITTSCWAKVISRVVPEPSRLPPREPARPSCHREIPNATPAPAGLGRARSERYRGSQAGHYLGYPAGKSRESLYRAIRNATTRSGWLLELPPARRR